MWSEVGEETGVTFDVQGRMVQIEQQTRWERPEDQGAMMMEFGVRRL